MEQPRFLRRNRVLRRGGESVPEIREQPCDVTTSTGPRRFRFEYTIWTAVALLAVLTVRTYGDMPDKLEAPAD